MSDLKNPLPLPHLDFEILVSLGRHELHGYAIAKEIQDRTDGVMHPGMSSLYLSIRRLVSHGLVEDAGERAAEESAGPQRRYYRITKLGRTVAQREAARIHQQAKAARKVFSEA